MEHWLYGQRLSLSFFLGCLLILGGLLVIARQ
jgi:hypothetical protein